MATTLKNNAYHILGLDTTASERDVSKRSKEIINRLKADDLPEFPLDTGFFEGFRTEESVKDALQRLQAPKKRIIEYFFWFQISDETDEKALEYFKQKDFFNAIELWKSASDTPSTKALLYKKNMALLYSLGLSTEDNVEYLKSSLLAWKEVIDSDRFWAAFSKIYELHDEQTASKDIVADFKRHVVEYLADLYTELYHVHKNSAYVNEFQKTFSVKGEHVEKSVLAPAFHAINQAVEALEKMEVSKDNVFDKEEVETIKQLIAKVQAELNRLIDLGLYDDSQTKIMRDRSANAIRSIVLDLHNNLSELHKSEGLLQVAIKLAGTDSLKAKLESELEQIQNNVKADTENVVAVEIPAFVGSNFIIFKNTYLEYKNKRVFYKDILNVSYGSTATTSTVYGVPLTTSYEYNWSIASAQENISLSLSASKEESKAKEGWTKLIALASNLIEPVIVKNMTERIFDRGETVQIGEVEFSKQGYSKMKFKMFGKNEKLTVYWSDTIYIPKLQQGLVYMWEDKDGTSAQFAQISMSVPNAVILPELVQACYDRRET